MPQYIRIPLSQGKVALVDVEDAERVRAFKWSALCPHPRRKKPIWYAVRGIYSGGKRQAVYLHRFILDAPDGVEVDHENGNGLDCRRSNLRLASDAQNAQNSTGGRVPQSGYRGVYWSRQRLRWFAEICVGGRKIKSGLFRDAEDAARRRDELARRHHGEFAVLNFPGPGERGWRG